MSSRDGGRDHPDNADSLSRRSFVGAVIAGAVVVRRGAIDVVHSGTAQSAATQIPAFALDELTIDDLQARLRGGAETSRSLVQQYLARIDALSWGAPYTEPDIPGS